MAKTYAEFETMLEDLIDRIETIKYESILSAAKIAERIGDEFKADGKNPCPHYSRALRYLVRLDDPQLLDMFNRIRDKLARDYYLGEQQSGT